MMTKNRATLLGALAILLWSTMVGLVRSVSELLGPTGGAAMIYSVAAVMLCLTMGWPKIGRFPRRYLLLGSSLFVAYEVCIALAIGHAGTATQAIEVSIVNYLWPGLTVLFAILFNGQRASLWIVPGLALSLFGVCYVQGGDHGLQWAGMLANIRLNPLSYALALIGAVLWASYCTVTSRMANGQNGVPLFFVLTALTLWVKFLLGGETAPVFSAVAAGWVVLAAGALGAGYALWNVGILHGHVTLLAGFSYFTPILSALFAMTVLHSSLAPTFWPGALMVCGGSILSWWATRQTA